MCVVIDDGNAKCWGWNAYGQCAIGTSADVGGVGFDGTSPVAMLGAGRTVQQVAGGWYHMCALLDGGSVKCWGWGGETLGYGDTTNRGTNVNELGENLPEVDLGTGKVAKALYSGYGSICVILTDDSTKCWGKAPEVPYGDSVVRGTAPGEMGDNLSTIDFGTGRHATHISTGDNIGCAVLDDGGVKCWAASNAAGKLGQDITGLAMGDSFPPIRLGTGKVAVKVSTKTSHACAVFDDGTLKCWGPNSNGQLGLGDSLNRGETGVEMGDNLPAVDVGTGRTVTSVSVSASFTCAVLDDGSSKCWGSSGSNGQLGQGDSISRGAAANTMGDYLPPIDLGINPLKRYSYNEYLHVKNILIHNNLYNDSLSDDNLHFDNLNDRQLCDNKLRNDATESTVTPTEPPPLDDQAFARLEQQRKEEAAAAVNALDSAEEAAVGQSLQLLSSLLENSNATDGAVFLAEVSVATDAGVLKVVALSATSVAPESNVSVGGEDGTSVTVPGTVLQQAAAAAGSGLVLLSVTSLSENVTDKIGSDDARLGRRLATAASALRGQSVSLNFRDAEGRRIEVKNLETPMEMVLQVENENATCAYYDEATLSWSEEGLETVMDGIPGQITCRTTHLSIFGGVLQFVLSNVIATLKCSTAAQLLSAEALAMLGTSAWLSYGPSVVIFVSLAVFAMVFGCALRMDRRANQAIPWEKKEPVLLRKKTTVAQLIEELPPEEPKTCWERIKSVIGAAVDWTLWFIGLLFGYENLAEVVKEFLPNAPVSTVNRCITTIHAHKTGTSRDSIDGVKKLSKTFSRSMSMT
ncbi:HERC1 [Symbiodinium sp. CCMP2456]|nr:HERC1 [Symbiodinium sp. CCMP2456]